MNEHCYAISMNIQAFPINGALPSALIYTLLFKSLLFSFYGISEVYSEIYSFLNDFYSLSWMLLS